MSQKPKIVLNCFKFTGSFAGKEVVLTRAEFIILCSIIFAKGGIIDPGEFPNIAAQSVRVHFSKLRRKMKLPRNAIICEDNEGYRANLEYFNWEVNVNGDKVA